MNTILSSILIVIFSFGLTQWLPLPWYTPIIVSFFIGIGLGVLKMPFKSFSSGFFGVAVFWLIKCLGPLFTQSGPLTSKLSSLFTEFLGFTITPFILLLITILLGGLLGGLATVSANLLMSEESNTSNKLGGSRKSRSKSYKLKLN